MHRSRARSSMSVSLLALILLIPVTDAGSEHAPDIVDVAGDVDVQLPWALNVAVPEVDILAVWVDVGATNVSVSVKLSDLEKVTVSGETVSHSFTFRNAEYERASVSALRYAGSWYFFFTAARWDGTIVTFTPAGTANATTDVLKMDLPRSLVSSTLERTRASASVVVNVQGTGFGGGTVWLRDWAPDATYGPDIPISSAGD